MGFCTRGSNASGSRDPNWQYHSRPAMWTKDGKCLKVLTLAGVKEWNMMDLDKVTQQSLQDFPTREEHSINRRKICLSSDNDLLYAISDDTAPIQLIDIMRGSFRTVTSLVPNFSLGLEQAYRGVSRSPLAVKIEANSLLMIDASTLSEFDLSTSDLRIEEIFPQWSSDYSHRQLIDRCKFSGNNTVGIASKIAGTSRYEFSVEILTIFKLKPFEKIWAFQVSTHRPQDSVLFDIHPIQSLVAWSTPQRGVQICNYERPEQPFTIRDRGYTIFNYDKYVLTGI